MSALDVSLDDLIKSRTTTSSKKQPSKQPSERRPEKKKQQQQRGPAKMRSEDLQQTSRANRRSGAVAEQKSRRSAATNARRDMAPSSSSKGSIFDRLSGGNKPVAENSVAVSNLPFDVLEPELRQLFAKAGGIRDVAVVYDSSGRSTGRATVTFASLAGAKQGVAKYDKVAIDNRSIKVVMATGEAPRAAFPSKQQKQRDSDTSNVRAGLFGTALNSIRGDERPPRTVTVNIKPKGRGAQRGRGSARMDME